MTLDLCEATGLDEEASYDIITLLDVVEHIPVFEMEALWQKMGKILRPGGIVVFSTPILPGPNASDHTDGKSAVSGIHCNKQTKGTIARTCIRNGFILGANNERCFGLLKLADAALFPEDRRQAFFENHRKFLAALSLCFTPDVSFGEEEVRSLVPAPGRILIGSVVENNPVSLLRALRLVQSLRWLGGKVSGSNVMICVTEGVDPSFRETLETWGAFVRTEPRLSPVHRCLDKLRFFERPEISSYDTVVFVESDSIIVQDPEPTFSERALQAGIVTDRPISRERMDALVENGLRTAGRTVSDALAGNIGIVDTGVLILPVQMSQGIVPVWRRHAERLLQGRLLPPESAGWWDAISLSLALLEHPVPFRELHPPVVLFHRNVASEQPGAFEQHEPVILRYGSFVERIRLPRPISLPAGPETD